MRSNGAPGEGVEPPVRSSQRGLEPPVGERWRAGGRKPPGGTFRSGAPLVRRCELEVCARPRRGKQKLALAMPRCGSIKLEGGYAMLLNIRSGVAIVLPLGMAQFDGNGVAFPRRQPESGRNMAEFESRSGQGEFSRNRSTLDEPGPILGECKVVKAPSSWTNMLGFLRQPADLEILDATSHNTLSMVVVVPPLGSPKLVKRGPNLVNSGPNLADGCQTCPKFGPNSANSGPAFAETAQIRSQISRSWPRIDVRPTSAEFGLSLAKLGPRWQRSGRLWPRSVEFPRN